MVQQAINDIDVYNSTYDKYAPALYGVILKHTHDRQLAGDILKQSFVKICEDLHSYDVSKNRLFTYMLRTTIQECKKNISLSNNVLNIAPAMYIVK